MSGQDIIADLEKRQTYHNKRRIPVAIVLIVVGYWMTMRFLEGTMSLISGERSKLSPSSSSWTDTQTTKNLIKIIDQRRSNYLPGTDLLGVTAIINISSPYQAHQSGDRVALLLRFLVKYPFIKEIIIWNDDVISSGFNMNGEELLSIINSTNDNDDRRVPMPILRVINSPGGMGEMSGHMACSLAKFDTCYHTDVNMDNLNLDTLYTKYLESNGEEEATLVDHASLEEYLIESEYNIWQPNHSLSTGIVSKLRRGTLAAKKLSTRYFQQLTSSIDESYDTKERRDRVGISRSISIIKSDIQFSVWSNRKPLKLISPLSFHHSSLVNDHHTFSGRKPNLLDPQFIKEVNERLNKTIQRSDPFQVSSLFPRALRFSDEEYNNRESEIGVGSAYDDQSMLITNLDFPREWSFAIDGDLSTCWKDLSSKQGSFIGLNFVKDVSLKQLTIFGQIQPENWRLEIYSTQSKKWIPKPTIPRIIDHQEPPLTKFVYDLQPSSSFSDDDDHLLVKKFRLIMGSNLREQPEHKASSDGITVCGWMINEDWVI
ncbi:hypothetical protein PSTG_12453 [Puccinia striiformis f. sp. tritici PST-78]|uniref:Uncharacterized protein n=1 Tax=Puccinia striiformis f. sp. tritici PST-78 TaxID=1165861 RepID=A0A0L0V4J7_9BASI|nr:hypothetical protein PSTG_12453 [Puccinia striiformis f. sp. tritici PST-78]